MTRKVLWPRVIFGLLFALVTFLTLTPNPEDAKAGFEFTRRIAKLLFHDAALGDKVAHFLAYASLGAMGFWAEMTLFKRRRGAALGLAAYGIFLEWLQGVGGVRTPDVWDAVANGLGAVSGLVGAILLTAAIRRTWPV
ncbi:MAG: VanZ family protein [Parvularculaceae bacterium]